MKKYKRGLVPISGDPITYGHLSLIEKALSLCEEVVVFIANNDNKKYLFSLSERALMAQKAIFDKNIKKARIISNKNLLADVYLRENCDVLLRGIRSQKDSDYEDEQMLLHKIILPSLEGHIVYLEADKDMKYISSSVVKSFIAHYLGVENFTLPFIQRLLEERMLGQYKIAITGGISVGKSFVAKELVKTLKKDYNISAFCINIDELVRGLYKEKSPAGDSLREFLVEKFGNDVLLGDKSDVDREVLKKKIFRKEFKHLRRELHEMTSPHIKRKYREELSGKKGIVILEWAQLAEMSMGRWTNNNAIVVDSPDKAKFANIRNIDEAYLYYVKKYQWSASRKTTALKQQIELDKCGEVIEYNNIYNNRNAIKDLAKKVVDLFKKSVF